MIEYVIALGSSTVVALSFAGKQAYSWAKSKNNEIKQKAKELTKYKTQLEKAQKTSDHLLQANEELTTEVKDKEEVIASIKLGQLDSEKVINAMMENDKIVEQIEEKIQEKIISKMSVFPHKWKHKNSSPFMITKKPHLQDNFVTYECEKCTIQKRGWEFGILEDDDDLKSGFFLLTEKIKNKKEQSFCVFDDKKEEKPVSQALKKIESKEEMIVDAVQQHQKDTKKRKKREKL